MFIDIFILSFAAVLFLEIGDKTQLIVLSITTKYQKQKLAILAGFSIAIFVVSLLGVSLGFILKEIIPENFIKYLGASLFIIIGLITFYDYYKEKNDNSEVENFDFTPAFKTVLIQTFTLIFMVEMGDKSQIAIITIATQTNDLIAVALGASVAMSLLAIIAIAMGDIIIKIIPETIIKLISSVLFILIGIFVFIF